MCDKVEKIYPILIKVFYADLKFNKWMITSKVLKTKISITIEEFKNVCNLPIIDNLYFADAPSSVANFYLFFAT